MRQEWTEEKQIRTHYGSLCVREQEERASEKLDAAVVGNAARPSLQQILLSVATTRSLRKNYRSFGFERSAGTHALKIGSGVRRRGSHDLRVPANAWRNSSNLVHPSLPAAGRHSGNLSSIGDQTTDWTNGS